MTIETKWIIPQVKMTPAEYQINRQLYTVVLTVVNEVNRKIESVYDDPAYWMGPCT